MKYNPKCSYVRDGVINRIIGFTLLSTHSRICFVFKIRSLDHSIQQILNIKKDETLVPTFSYLYVFVPAGAPPINGSIL